MKLSDIYQEMLEISKTWKLKWGSPTLVLDKQFWEGNEGDQFLKEFVHQGEVDNNKVRYSVYTKQFNGIKFHIMFEYPKQ